MFVERFKDQVAVVTGGASGIGFAIGQRIAQEGGRVVLFDTNEKVLDAALTTSKQQALAVSGSVVDVSHEQSVQGALEQVVSAHGQLDVMVNSAGIPGLTAVNITDYPADVYEKVFQVNLRGSFLMTKYAIRHMLKRNYGRVLLIASIAGKEGNPGMVGYTSTKAGVIGLVKGVGKEYAETGITVNGLAPAVIRTPMNENTAPATMDYMISRIPMKRMGTVEETAALACWIVSREASFNTGFVFDLTGGRAVY